ncbi:hypothetical protein K1719_001237 [Acacia pycnantha]|nr:hypothetical protein K1719_001237 [Acacia pycnantha]
MNSSKKNGKSLRKKNVLIVIAHPDDESIQLYHMFDIFVMEGYWFYPPYLEFPLLFRAIT